MSHKTLGQRILHSGDPQVSGATMDITLICNHLLFSLTLGKSAAVPGLPKPTLRSKRDSPLGTKMSGGSEQGQYIHLPTATATVPLVLLPLFRC